MKLILTLILSFTFSSLFAQLYCPPPFGKSALRGENKHHISLGVGLTTLRGDVNNNSAMGLAYSLGYDYQIGRGIYIGAEGQLGTLEVAQKVQDPRFVENGYKALMLKAKFHPFQIFLMEDRRPSFAKSAIEGIYLGVGVGNVWNEYNSIYRNKNLGITNGPIDYYAPDGTPVFERNTTSLILPTLDLGWAVPIKRSKSYSGSHFSFFVNAQFSFGANELIDGYIPLFEDGTPVNYDNDMYSFYSAGLKYSF